MGEFIFVLFMIGMVTVIGHGIWVLLAKIHRALSGVPESSSTSTNEISATRPRQIAQCAECGAVLHVDDSFCAVCGLSRFSVRPMDDLAATTRQLDRFLTQGRLDRETHKLVIGLVNEERARLIAPVRRDAATMSREIEAQAPPPGPAPAVPVAQMARAIEQPVESAVSVPGKIAAASNDIPAVVAEIPRRPRRSLTEVLETFMEESSIRWGELIGGLLIIGCSIALVVSLWAEISERPFLKFSVFAGVTASLFGIGFYSAHRWKLPTTSRGVLITSTLLAPLNFLAMAAFSRDLNQSSWLLAGAELFSLALFFFLVYQAARVFLPEAPWMTALATMGPSFAMLLARHASAAEGYSLRAALLGVAPLLSYCVSCGVTLRDQSRSLKGDESDERGADQIFTHLGVASFSTLLPLGLLFFKPGYISQTLRQFAPLVSFFGIPAIVTGVALLQWPAESQSGKTQTAATSVSLIGSLISMGALIFAWPSTVAVIVTALINCAVALTIALASSRRVARYDLRLAHAVAIAHLSLAALTVANLFSGNVTWWGEDGPRLGAKLFSITGGYALTLLFALFAGASEWWLKKEKKIESRIYGISAAGAGTLGLLIIVAHGSGIIGDPNHVAEVYAFYSLAAFIIAWRREKVVAGWIGSALLSLAILQTLGFKFRDALAEYHPVRLSFLVFANVATIAAVAVTVKSGRAKRLFADSWSLSALIASVAVTPFLLFEGWMTTTQISTRLLWLAAIWLVIAWLKQAPVLFAAFQTALALSVIFKIADLFGHQWPHSFTGDLRTIQAQAVALAMLSLVWIAARITLGRFGAAASEVESRKDEEEKSARLFDRAVAAKLLYPAWPRVDRVVTAVLLVFLAGLSLYGAYIRIVQGFLPDRALSVDSANFGATALGAGSWSLLAALSLVFVAGLWERFEKRAALAMLILLACACLLITGQWEEARFTPTVYRWSSTIAFAVVSLLIVARNRVTPFLNRFAWPRMEDRSDGLPAMLRRLSLALFVLPVLIFSTVSFYMWLGRIGEAEFSPKLSIVIAGLVAPLLIIGLSFISHAVRERSAAQAGAAGLMVNLSVTFGYLLWASARATGIEHANVYTVAQLNIIATSICSLVWLRFHRRQTALNTAWPRSNEFLDSQIGLAAFASLSALAVADIRVFIDPRTRSALADSFGGLTGILAVALPMLAYARFRGFKLRQLRAERLGVGLIVIGSLVSCLVGRFDADGWGGFHALALALNAAAWLTLALRKPVRLLAPVAQFIDQRALENWATAFAWAAIAMTLRGVSSTGEPWWTLGFSISICLLFAGLSLASGNRAYTYIAALALNYAATRIYFWMGPAASVSFVVRQLSLPWMLSLNTVVLALPSIAWLAIDLKSPRQEGARQIEPFHRMAALTSLLLLGVILFFRWLYGDWALMQTIGQDTLDWLALASVVALLAACLWDKGFPYAISGLHIAGLFAAAMGLLAFNLQGEVFLVSAGVIISLYILATSVLLRARSLLAHFAARLRIPSRKVDLDPLIGINMALSLAAYIITLVIVLGSHSLMKRLIATTASIAIPVSMGFLANLLRNQGLITKKGRAGQGQASDNDMAGDAGDLAPTGFVSSMAPNSLISLTSWISFFSVVLWGWAWLSPLRELLNVSRLAVVMVAAGAILAGYKLIIIRKLSMENEWRQGMKARLLIITAIGIVALLCILFTEAWNFSLPQTPDVPWWVVIAVFAALVSLFCACIAYALSPERDPFNLSERGRMNYVYVAEALVMVTVIHARLSMPRFFTGFFLTWWPLVVMTLAFTGVGLGEVFRRRGKLVLAEPLERTGILLPILPVLGVWIVDSRISPSNALFLVGLFYGALSVMRRSFRFGLLAAFAGNGGLWNLLYGTSNYGFYIHPQLWFIPVSVSVLVAGHVNRERLTTDQTTLIRYTTLMTIYISSTSDIFINGMSQSLWLTIVLTLLSVAGVFTGLMLRIRAFLFLGTTFLLLSLLTIIWTASITWHWNWLWYVTGIAFGIMIIATFALFERKRHEMLELVGRLKQWQA